MKMPPEVLTRLLRGEHFNVEQRDALGLWPPEELRYTELLDHLVKLLETGEWFPQPPSPSESVYVRHRGPRDYICMVWPEQGKKSTERLFASAREAGEFYLKWGLNLPGSLDSWPVVDDR